MGVALFERLSPSVSQRAHLHHMTYKEVVVTQLSHCQIGFKHQCTSCSQSALLIKYIHVHNADASIFSIQHLVAMTI